MRAFIAIDFPQDIHAALAEKQKAFRAASTGARWTHPEGIHLTLKFLGEVPEQKVQRVIDALAGLGPFESFTVEVAGFGFFPNARRPRVFWAGLKVPANLGELAARIEAAMEPLGFAKEQRQFTPHLTLARFKDPRPQPALQQMLESNSGEARKSPVLGSFTVSEFFLFESKLSPHGAEYSKVAKFPVRT